MSYTCEFCKKPIRIKFGHNDLMPHGGWCSCLPIAPPDAQPAPDAVPIGAYVLATKYADADPGGTTSKTVAERLSEPTAIVVSG